MAKKQYNRAGLTGPEGLIVAIICQAHEDLQGPQHRQTAAAYFHSETFQYHLELLGMPPDLLPKGVDRAGVHRFVVS